MLILFLNLCKELRDFCGFTKVPDAPLLTRFKQDFLSFIEDMFNKLVDFTEPICKAVDSSLFKINMCIAGRRTRNHTTTKADVFSAGIASQFTVIIAYSMKRPKYIRSLKPLIA